MRPKGVQTLRSLRFGNSAPAEMKCKKLVGMMWKRISGTYGLIIKATFIPSAPALAQG